MAATSISRSPTTPTEPGFIMSLSLGGSSYKVLAYFEEASGAKTYLPSTIDSLARDKIRDLTYSLLNAHDFRRTSQNQPPYDIKTVDAKGLMKTDNTLISHDFHVAPFVTPTLANLMVTALTSAGNPMLISDIKAQHIWDTMEGYIRRSVGPLNSNPFRMDATSSSSSVIPPLSTLPQTSTTSSTSGPVSSISMDLGLHANPSPHTTCVDSSLPTATSIDPSLPASSLSALASMHSSPSTTGMDAAPSIDPGLPAPASMHSSPHTIDRYPHPNTAISIHPSLLTIDYNQADWYAHIPPRLKLRIVNDILMIRSYGAIIYKNVWEHFENLCGGSPKTTTRELLQKEKKRLIKICKKQYSQISRDLRAQAEMLIEDFYGLTVFSRAEFQKKMTHLMKKDFDCKDQLLQLIYQRAVAKGVKIDALDHKWAENHYLDDDRLFVQCLRIWLDNI